MFLGVAIDNTDLGRGVRRVFVDSHPVTKSRRQVALLVNGRVQFLQDCGLGTEAKRKVVLGVDRLLESRPVAGGVSSAVPDQGG